MSRSDPIQTFDAVYAALFNDVYAYFCLCFGEQVAQDLSQEIFLRVWRAIDQGREPENWRAWVFRCAVNLKNDFLRRRYAENHAQETVEPPPPPSAADGDSRIAVAKALAALPEEERELLIFKNAGLSSQEIGETLHISASAVRTRLQKAKQDFKERLEAEGISNA